MISVIIPTLNAGRTLGATLASLLDANRRGLIREVIISDGGSNDRTAAIADEAGASFVTGAPGRGTQLQRGAALARGEWLLFLHADTQLSDDWTDAAVPHMAQAFDRVAGVFSLQFDAAGVKPWLVAKGANLRARLLKLPYGDQGLLISRRHYDRLGGFADMAMFEDVDLVRRLTTADGRKALALLPAIATTSADRYLNDGYLARVVRNARCVRMYFSGVPMARIMEVYHGGNNRGRGSATLSGDGQAAIGRAGKDST